MARTGWETVATWTGEGRPFVVVTVAQVRGHAPRGPGSKMCVRSDAESGSAEVAGSVGGGSLERTAVLTATRMLTEGARDPVLHVARLDRATTPHGVQCCGGEVTLLLEPVRPARPVVAVFGAGHVGRALVHVLELLPLDVRVADSRPDELALVETGDDHVADIECVPAPVPEAVARELPAGAHVFVMTHDHHEDLAVLDTCLRRDDLGLLGVIGSESKWRTFRHELRALGHDDGALTRVTSPIGIPGVPGKSPAAIAVATAAQLLTVLDLPESMT
ncbi:xanthine dehydrogenase accessory protein XdhC [Aquipuribacter nitratireducens]|uniref:Xanthine dehydrogenase accessory protein XdhC n=1 Tax=Aquipuribacter nitratireducens TaxID=650104 RepID=A0ABW0GRL8_9MICO